MRAYIPHVLVHGASGGIMASPAGFYSDDRVADTAAKELAQRLQAIIQGGTIILATPTGPKKACSVGEFLGMLGITGFGCSTVHGEMKGSIETVSPRIVIPATH